MSTTTKDPPGPPGVCLAQVRCRLRGELLSSLRHFVRDVLRVLGDGEAAWVAQLLTSELLTNTLVHTPSLSAELRVVHDPDSAVVWIGVRDDGPRFDRLDHAGSPDSETGRGIPLVAELSHQWGVDASGVGKTVWFRLLLHPGQRLN